ncbi:hypothetical protein J3L11_06240 [Shewanella sp. 4t3-1-2LB]|uniref:Uncharacterized protein n=1 Tax=Shewanella fodinae TaxID=552357 RepID=A0A4R2F6S0_9GAMM|nr:hypothetical protein [Shewanella sp. 4t3-1-2LB]MBO1271250.1 hypothetical protein [Shewanella sp. 4t3-1-2LB]TCN78522.1 hypothetical protein EDC91_1386 [Shewanella fodinae]
MELIHFTYSRSNTKVVYRQRTEEFAMKSAQCGWVSALYEAATAAVPETKAKPAKVNNQGSWKGSFHFHKKAKAA